MEDDFSSMSKTVVTDANVTVEGQPLAQSEPSTQDETGDIIMKPRSMSCYLEHKFAEESARTRTATDYCLYKCITGQCYTGKQLLKNYRPVSNLLFSLKILKTSSCQASSVT